jgi:hypothetical protein
MRVTKARIIRFICWCLVACHPISCLSVHVYVCVSSLLIFFLLEQRMYLWVVYLLMSARFPLFYYYYYMFTLGCPVSDLDHYSLEILNYIGLEYFCMPNFILKYVL